MTFSSPFKDRIFVFNSIKKYKYIVSPNNVYFLAMSLKLRTIENVLLYPYIIHPLLGKSTYKKCKHNKYDYKLTRKIPYKDRILLGFSLYDWQKYDLLISIFSKPP